MSLRAETTILDTGVITVSARSSDTNYKVTTWQPGWKGELVSLILMHLVDQWGLFENDIRFHEGDFLNRPLAISTLHKHAIAPYFPEGLIYTFPEDCRPQVNSNSKFYLGYIFNNIGMYDQGSRGYCVIYHKRD